MGVIIRLNHDSQFKKLYKKGKSCVLPSLVVYVRENGQGINRIGITASKKIGNAVTRNRAKRRIRELYRVNLVKLKAGYDFVIVARARTAKESYEKLSAAFFKAMESLGVMNE